MGVTILRREVPSPICRVLVSFEFFLVWLFTDFLNLKENCVNVLSPLLPTVLAVVT